MKFLGKEGRENEEKGKLYTDIFRPIMFFYGILCIPMEWGWFIQRVVIYMELHNNQCFFCSLGLQVENKFLWQVGQSQLLWTQVP